MKIRKCIVLSTALVLLASCGNRKGASYHSSNRKKSGIFKVSQYKGDKGTLTWAHYDATKRGSMIYVDPDNNVRVLAENPPDAAIQSITEISAKISDIKGGGSVDAALKAQRSIAELGKRTAAVNMMRDALYRLNEMYYSSVDSERSLIKKREEYFKKLVTKKTTCRVKNGSKTKDGVVSSIQWDKIDSALKYINRLYPVAEKVGKENEQFLKPLFKEVLCRTKEIAIEEAQAEIKITENEAKIAESVSKQEVQKSKERQAKSKYDALMKVFESVKDSLSTDEKKKYLEEIQKIDK